ncbi:MAG: hypothetical protein Q8O79_04940 [Pseudomonadota bacterium]|nr:hypothetical protein [Pseudomonadota bacterium]
MISLPLLVARNALFLVCLYWQLVTKQIKQPVSSAQSVESYNFTYLEHCLGAGRSSVHCPLGQALVRLFFCLTGNVSTLGDSGVICALPKNGGGAITAFP